MIFLRALLFNLGFYVGTGILAIAGLPFFIRRSWLMAYSRFWTGISLAWLKLSVGLGWELRGAEHLPPPPFILAPKHQSAWDTLILNQLVPKPAIVLKRELIWIPVFGWYLLRAGGIVIDRKAGATALRKLVSQGRRAVAEGRPIVIFPEGTRGPVGGKLPYQPGVAALYAQLNVPMVPVALNSGLFWSRKAFFKLPGTIIVEILPPIPPGLERRKALAVLEERIESATHRLLETAPAPDGPVDEIVESA